MLHDVLLTLHQKFRDAIPGTSELTSFEELLYLRGWKKDLASSRKRARNRADMGKKRDGRDRRVTPTERRAQMVQAFRVTMVGLARRERLNYPMFAG